METVTSLFLLLISSLLIFSVLSQIDIGSNDKGDLIELRTYQARSLGETLMMFSNNSMEPPYLDNVSNASKRSAFFWDGNSFHNQLSSGLIVDGYIQEVLETTPDGLSAFLLLEDEQIAAPGISGEYISWSYRMSNGPMVTLYLSLHMGSIEVMGWGE